jgi:hypothetical protein
LDIETAFLNGDLGEVIYMKNPKGYADIMILGVLRARLISVYGLVKAAR